MNSKRQCLIVVLLLTIAIEKRVKQIIVLNSISLFIFYQEILLGSSLTCKQLQSIDNFCGVTNLMEFSQTHHEIEIHSEYKNFITKLRVRRGDSR